VGVDVDGEYVVGPGLTTVGPLWNEGVPYVSTAPSVTTGALIVLMVPIVVAPPHGLHELYTGRQHGCGAGVVAHPAAIAATIVNIKSLRMAGILRKMRTCPVARLWVKQLYPTPLDVQTKRVDFFQPLTFPGVEKVLQFTWPAQSWLIVRF